MESRVVRELSEREFEFIAALDYGQDSDRHLAALRSVCVEQRGILHSDQLWFPYEVIELGSHKLVPGHEREFAACTLLVLANVAVGVDTSTDLKEKFKDRAADYDRLPLDLREEILGAYEAAEC